MNVGEGYWKVINESLPNLKRHCIQLLGKHFLSNPFFPLQVGDDKVIRNKHPETSFYTVKEDDCNIEIIDQQCQHVALTLDLPYHRPKDIELLGIAQGVERKNSLFIVLSLVAALLFPRSVIVGLKVCTYPP